MHAHLTALTEHDLVVLERRRLAADRALLVVVVGADAVAVARITRPCGRLTERRAARRNRRLLLLLLLVLLLLLIIIIITIITTIIIIIVIIIIIIIIKIVVFQFLTLSLKYFTPSMRFAAVF